MLPASLIASIPFALDGEAITSNNTGIAVIAVISMAAGYVLLFALWYFVFREKARAKRDDRDSPD